MSDTALAEVRSWRDLHEALRRRAESLDISRATLDDVSGLCSGYSAKILAPTPIRSLGRISLDALLGALGCKLVLVEDGEALARVEPRA
jgi:hypothetical protein